MNEAIHVQLLCFFSVRCHEIRYLKDLSGCMCVCVCEALFYYIHGV